MKKTELSQRNVKNKNITDIHYYRKEFRKDLQSGRKKRKYEKRMKTTIQLH